MASSSDNPYLRDAVLTATPEQLQLMLYDGAIRFALQARDAIGAKDYERSYERLTRAQNIITEMQAGLNHEVSPELCKRVNSIYDFLFGKLVDANLHRDVGAIDDALKILRIERQTWQMVVDKINQTQSDREESAPAVPAETGNDEEAPVGFSVEG